MSEQCSAKSALVGLVCGEPAEALYVGICVHEHVAERHLCAGHAEPEEPLWCRVCYAIDGHVCPVTLTLSAGHHTDAALAAGTGSQR